VKGKGKGKERREDWGGKRGREGEGGNPGPPTFPCLPSPMVRDRVRVRALLAFSCLPVVCSANP